MSQVYSDPSRASDPYALPDVELWEGEVWDVECSRGCGVFEVDDTTVQSQVPNCYCPSCGYNSGMGEKTERSGWYWQPCFPGCLPDGDVHGPYSSEHAAMLAIREE